MTLRGAAAIVGVGELKPVRRTSGRGPVDLIAEVGRLALEDAGLTFGDVDGLLVDPLNESPFLVPSSVAEYLGLHVTFAELVDLGGATGAGMVWRAAAAIAAGQCETCLCVCAAPREGRGFGWAARLRPSMDSPDMQFEFPYGAAGANFGYAMIAKRYEHEYGLKEEHRAKIAVDQRTNACANPMAYFHGQPITLEDVLSSPVILDPLRMLEIVMPTGGGAALVVTRAERARKLRPQPAYLLGAGEAVTHKSITYAPSLTSSAIKVAADRAFDQAGVARSDVKMGSIYDCYTITVLVSLEDAGFCEKGEAGEFVASHDLTFEGDFPVNTHGGQLSFGQPGMAGGMSHVTEGARQIMGTCRGRQVPDCDLVFVNGNGGIMSEQVSLILGRTA
jgi:acetyl-CoA acetyltransferase